MSSNNQPHWQRLLFLGGVIIGLTLAGYSALNGGRAANPALPPGAIASVGDTIILRADFVRALKAVSAGKQNPLTQEDEAAILQRLIEEEILVQRALDMQLVHQDPALRNALVDAITKDIVARSRAKPVSPVLLRDYFFKNKARFARPARVYVRAVFLPKGDAAAQMAAFDRALANASTPQYLGQQFGQYTPPVPDGLIPLQKLKDYVGPNPVNALDSLGSGEWSDWIEDKAGVWRIYLVNRTRARTPELESIQTQVEAALLDERDDAALRSYLNRLTRKTRITLSPDAPK